MIDLWNGLLHSTGGALVAKKSYWHWIDFQWTGTQWIYSSPPLDNPPLTILNYANGLREPLSLLPCTEGRKTLGVHLRPDGKEFTTFEALRRQAQHWADRLRSHPLPPATSWLALQSTLLKSLEYPLPATTLTSKECQAILWPALKIALPLSKIQRRFPRHLLHAPPSLMGLGLPSLFLTQLYQHLSVLLTHSHEQSITGHLLRSTVETLRLELGSCQSPLTLPWTQWGTFATPTWLTFTWQTASTYGLGVTDNTKPPSPLRSNDVTIMDFLTQRGLSIKQLTTLNHCRLYLNLFWASELYTAQGDTIDPHILRGEKSPNGQSLCHWPRQGTPSTHAWNLWKSTITTHFCQSDGPGTTHPRLVLGPFLHHWADPLAHHYRWLTLWDPDADRIFTQDTSGSWRLWTRLPTRRRTKLYLLSPNPQPLSSLPLSSCRASVLHLYPTRLRLLATDSSPPSPLSLPQITTNPEYPRPLHPPPPTSELQSFIASQPIHLRWPVQHLTFTTHTTMLPFSLKNGTLKAVSDGSWKAPHGAAAFILGDTRHPHTILARGANTMPPAFPIPLHGSSYRSEISGLLGVLRFTHLIDRLYRIPTGGATIACDSKGALSQVFGAQPLSHKQPDFDLLSLAREILLDLPHITFTVQHVQGHQDDGTLFQHLDHWAQWNVSADLIAKAHVKYLEQHPTTPSPPISTDRWQLWSTPHRAWSVLRPSLLHHHCCKSEVRSYWAKTRQLSPLTVPTVDWQGLTSALSSTSLTRQRWVVKHNTDQCGVGRTLVRWKEATSATCPRCDHPEETTAHDMRCRGLRSDQVWQQSLLRFARQLQKTHTDPEIISAIVNGMRSWHNATLPVCHSRNPLLRQAWAEQKELGWENCLRGFISLHWRATQLLYQQQTQRDQFFSEERWVASLIKGLWSVAWDQWEYRNSILHSPLHRVHLTLVHQLDAAITQEYSQGLADLPSTFSPLFQLPLTQLLHKPVQYRQHWLHHVASARQRGNSEAHPYPSDYNSERTSLRRWLRTGRVIL